jgi:hypothetical protein
MQQARAGRGRRSVRDEESVLGTVHDNPSTGTRNISSGTGRLPQSAVWHILRENQLCTFHVQPVQELQVGDKHLRLQFSRWVLHKIVDIPQFLWLVLWTEEAVFTRSVHNLHTCMYGQRRILMLRASPHSRTDVV